MTHTPGPWRYETATKTIRSEPTNYWLASMDSWDGAVKPHNEANARLMAAAPNLLAALTWLRDELGTAIDPRPPSVEAMLAMCAAISKAEGPKP